MEDDLEGAIRELKAERDGEIEVAGPDLAHSLTELGLIDEYRIYLHSVVAKDAVETLFSPDDRRIAYSVLTPGRPRIVVQSSSGGSHQSVSSAAGAPRR